MTAAAIDRARFGWKRGPIYWGANVHSIVRYSEHHTPGFEVRFYGLQTRWFAFGFLLVRSAPWALKPTVGQMITERTR